jgi:3-hydroxyisobutyrate dehydrogenase
MGEPMVRRLAAAGYQVRGYDVAAPATQRLAGTPGVTITSTVGDVADGADAVILMLPDSAAVESVLLGDGLPADGLPGDGLLARVRPPALVADMSSSEPARTRSLAERAAAHGLTLIDAPVSGGVVGARAGSLTIMTGGSADALARLRPVFEVLGGMIVHAGEIPGAGHAIKALNNLMSAAHLLVSAETILAGQAFGLDPAVIVDIINGSSGRSGSTQTKWPRYILPASFDSGFSMRFMVKDMKIALQLADAAGIRAQASRAALDAWARAAEEMPPGADHTEIARWVQQASAAFTAAPGNDGGQPYPRS